MLLEVRDTPTYFLPRSPPLTSDVVIVGTLFICFVGQLRQDKGIVAVENWLTALFNLFLGQLVARVPLIETATTIATTPPSTPSSTTLSSPTRVIPSPPRSPSVTSSSAPSRSSSPPLPPIDPFSDSQSPSSPGGYEIETVRPSGAEFSKSSLAIPKSSVKVDDIRKEKEMKMAVSQLNDFLVKRGAGALDRMSWVATILSPDTPHSSNWKVQGWFVHGQTGKNEMIAEAEAPQKRVAKNIVADRVWRELYQRTPL